MTIENAFASLFEEQVVGEWGESEFGKKTNTYPPDPHIRELSSSRGSHSSPATRDRDKHFERKWDLNPASL